MRRSFLYDSLPFTNLYSVKAAVLQPSCCRGHRIVEECRLTLTRSNPGQFWRYRGVIIRPGLLQAPFIPQ